MKGPQIICKNVKDRSDRPVKFICTFFKMKWGDIPGKLVDDVNGVISTLLETQARILSVSVLGTFHIQTQWMPEWSDHA